MNEYDPMVPGTPEPNTPPTEPTAPPVPNPPAPPVPNLTVPPVPNLTVPPVPNPPVPPVPNLTVPPVPNPPVPPVPNLTAPVVPPTGYAPTPTSIPGPGHTPFGGYYPPPAPPTPPSQGLAIAGLVLGIVSLVLYFVCCGLLTGLPALIGLILSIVACHNGNRSGMVIAALILNAFSLLLTVALILLLILGAAIENSGLGPQTFYEFYGNQPV